MLMRKSDCQNTNFLPNLIYCLNIMQEDDAVVKKRFFSNSTQNEENQIDI